MTIASRVCAECGATVFADAPEGLCSVCLFRSGLGLLDNKDDKAFEPTGTRMSKDFGDYELLEEIGRGGQGVVYRAHQKSLNRTVALKVIGLAHWATEAHVKRFRLEAEAAASLNHPCIVPIYEVGERDGACYFSMGLVDGGQLDAVAKREPMPIRHAAELIAKLARTVHYAHEHGILHRDIKPGNILLDAKGEPHLTDFGLARLVETESTVTRTLEVLGTPSYMAPEQAVGNNAAITGATDIYGLGAVLYQLLTGHPPFAGGTTYETVRLVLDTEPRQPRSWNRKIDRDLATICLKCLDKNPQRRYSSALALAEDLERWLKHEPIGARRTGIFTRGRKWVRRNPTSALLVASLVALAVAIGALALALPFYWHRNLTTSLPLEKSIAVLPFENLSKDEENAFFAGGVQDEILTNLAKIADLKVISRSSVMQYKSGVPRNLKDIAQQLGVTNVLEGSVRRAGSQVRVSVQLIDARTDTHVWAEHYDRDIADIFAIQSEIAQQIAEQLQAKLSAAEKAAIAQRPTTDLVAYAYYTKAQEIDVWSNWEGWEKSANQKVELLEKAVQRDPNFALAYCVLAKTQLYLAHDPKHFELGKKAAEAALRVRPDLGEAHLELARYYFYAAIFTDRNGYDRARDELTIARRKLPNNSEALLIAAKIDRCQNRWDSAVANLRKATELDPRDVEAGYWRGMTYFEMRRYSEYEQLLTKDAASGDPWSQCWLARIKLAQGDPVAAQSLLDQVPLDFRPAREVWWPRFDAALYLRDYDAASRVIASTPGEWADEAAVAEGQVARARGDKQKALAAFATAREKTDAIWGPRDDIDYLRAVSEIDAGLGRKEEAIREAQRAVDLTPIAKDPLERTYAVANLALVYAWTGERDRALEQLGIVAAIPAGPTYGDLLLNPRWDSLRGDPRFDKIVAAAKAASRYALTPLSEKSIAVLPLENLSDEKENAFFADGVHDELLSNLAKIKELKVISRTSVMQYKSGIARNLKEIAQQLGVSHVVEGSVRRSGDHVRVSVQLIDARIDRHIWGQNYDHTLADSLALQGDLATEIAGALRAKLEPEEKARLEAKPTKNSDAYVLYLKARERDTYGQTLEYKLRTEELYGQAIALDPTFAQAYARASLLNSDIYEGNHQEETKAKARAQAEEAVRLAPSLGDAHLALGLCLYWGEKDYGAALKEFALAAAASPNDPEVLSYIAGIYRRQGRWRESIASLQRVQDLDPRNGPSIYNAGLNYLLVRDWPAATACDNRLLEIAPDYAKIWLAYLEVYRNGTPASGRNFLRKIPAGVDPDGWVTRASLDLAMLERDFAAAEKVLNDSAGRAIDPDWPNSASLGQVALARGDAISAQRFFMAAAADMEARTRDHSNYPFFHESLGLIYAYMGRKEDAIREARRAVEMEPESQNAFHGALHVATLAQVYALTGEADQALTLIERLLTIPGPVQPTLSQSITLAELRLRWEWDSLRKYPRFQKILAGPEPKTVY